MFIASFITSLSCFGNEVTYFITNVQIKNNAVILKTHANRSNPNVECINAQRLDSWAIDLTSQGGANLFSLILGAFESNRPVILKGKNTCLPEGDIELLDKVKFKSKLN
ncbi:hypothetical protein [Pseudoalteromonas luteoviolacea]|nr:hypothetical protein [Pseudoalteromonas luteoviolacea]